MPPAIANVPEYESVEYWDRKYLLNERPFEWLLPPHVLGQEIHSILNNYPENASILHIGSGNSQLSFYLKDVIQNAERIHNLDFSQTALDWGMKTEARTNPENSRMEWIKASLTDIRSLLSVCEHQQYSIVVDKSTADSIACGPEVDIDIDFPLISSPTIDMSKDSQASYVLPLQVLAINLAYITKPGATWISLSYSQKRFDILNEDLNNNDQEYVDPALHDQGFPDVKQLWRLEKSVAIETAEEYKSNGSIVHRPKAEHYMFILQRTHVPVYLKLDAV